jgi:hypothetical protein
MTPLPQTDHPSDQPDFVVRLVHGKQPPKAVGAPAWPDIEGALLDDQTFAVPAFPLETLPRPWRTWIEDTARSVNVPADYVAQGVLAAVAGVCGAGVWVRVSSVWTDPLWLWLAVVGAPSSGKSPALAPVRRLLAALDKESASAGRAERERRPRGVVDHGSVETLLDSAFDNQRGVVLWRDEPAGCFAPLVAKGAIRALDPFPISILGALEPDRLAAALQRGEESLAARFLYAWPALPPFRPLADRTPARDDEALARLRAIRAVAGTMAEPLCLALDAGALATLDAFLAGLHAELQAEQRGADGLLAAWLGKGQGLVPRLAGVLHLLEWSARQASDRSIAVGDIDQGAIERAIALWCGYFRPHAKAFFGRVAPADLDARARRVVRWLLASGRSEVSREDIRRTALGQTVNASQADRVLARLTHAGVLRPLAPEARPQGGRPALRWEVNPTLQTA